MYMINALSFLVYILVIEQLHFLDVLDKCINLDIFWFFSLTFLNINKIYLNCSFLVKTVHGAEMPQKVI